MKRFKNIKLVVAFVALFSLLGCKKFLNVEPIDSLSGNNFWRNINDAETFTLEVYRLFRVGVGIDRPVLLIGDFRHAPIFWPSNAYPRRPDINMMSRGQIKSIITTPRPTPGTDADRFWTYNAEWDRVDDWTPVYKVIQSANILYDMVPKIAENDPTISAAIVKKYQAEAVFMRCMSYFILLRLYGDVPYYTDPYNEKPLPRTAHVEVANKCLEELAKIKNDLPWTYADPANRGVRAMRGSALALMMHLNMWCAGFDKKNAEKYYNAVDALGDELRIEGVEKEHAYELLPLDRTPEIFAGRTKEGLFEIPNNVNYGESLSNLRKTFFAHVLHEPYFTLNQNSANSEVVYNPSFLYTIFPESEADGRKELWFDESMYLGTGAFNYFKFFNFAYGQANTTNSVGNYQIVFRLADAILLQAEALAKLSKEAKAIELLNVVRERGQAGLYPSYNNYKNSIDDAIYYERCKELMGEGHYYYDLVRTEKIYDGKYTTYPMSYADFLNGGWTWPINAKALNNNPFMTLNDFWN